MQVRAARDDELAEVGELTVAAYAVFLDGERDPYAEHLRDAEGRHRDAELFVAVDGGGPLLGTVTTCPVGSPLRETGLGDEGELRMLAVAPHARGRGVGRALTEFCLDRFRGEGLGAAVLSTLPEMTAARRIYDQLGFARTPERDWRPFPDTLLVTYRKELA